HTPLSGGPRRLRAVAESILPAAWRLPSPARPFTLSPALFLVPRGLSVMGFKQTQTHKNGKGSYHQIGLVRGQFGNVPMDQWVGCIKDTGLDGWEEASWELDLRKCDTDDAAAAYARERVDLAKKQGLEIFTIATHLQGQALGDEPSAKTLQFVGGEAAQAY